MVSSLLEKLEELGLAEQGVVTPAQKMFAHMRLQGRSNTTNEYEGNQAHRRGNAIPLFSTTVAGTAGMQDYRHILDQLSPGDTLSLLQERNVQHEEARIAVCDTQTRQLGYLPAEDARVTASLLSAGKHLFARVGSIDEKQHWAEVAITVYLQDA